MALEISIWVIIITIALILYFAGIWFKTPHLFLLGCALVIGSGALLWGFDGLLLGQQVQGFADNGAVEYAPIIVSMTNIGLVVLSLVLVSIGIVSALVIDFGGQISKRSNVYHF